MELGLGVADRTRQGVDVVWRNQSRHQLHGPLLEHADRRPVRVSFDAAVRGIGVSAVMPASSSARVLTHAPWPSRLKRKTGRSGNDRVEGVPARDSAWERLHRPTVAGDPLAVRVRRRVRRDGSQMILGAVESIEVAFDPPQPARNRMRVGVGKSGQQRPTPEVDDPGRGASERKDLAVVADRADPIARHGEGGGAPSVRVHGPDAAAPKNEMRTTVRHGTSCNG